MTRYLKLYKAFCLLAAVALLWAGCKKDSKSNFNVNADVSLTAFSVNSVPGIIDLKTGKIIVNVPFGTDVTALAATMQMPGGASISPAAGTMNFTGPVSYRVTNGNLFKDYEVTVKIIPPLTSFKINGVEGTIDQENKTIAVILPDGTDLSALKPEIALQNGVSVSPSSGATQDFTASVNYTVKQGDLTAVYSVTVISNSINEYAFLGLASSRAGITNLDEKAAADWFFSNYPAADYISFASIEGGRSLANYKVIWWHYDSAQDLPAAALTPAVITALKDYRAAGGGLLLTTYAARYVEALGVVPMGKGPNNVFGDFSPNGFIEMNNNWGISFKTREDHPIFQGLETYEPGKAWMLEKGTFRLNHTAW
ncbi:MAG: DUF4960 domain-containing protein, partial [Sphingobacteriales bacterium]